MAVTFAELNSLPDILGGGRHELYFPNVPFVNAKNLMLTNTQVTLPNMGVGHIKAKLLGHSLGFRGGLSFDNIINCSFQELSNGAIVRDLFRWYRGVRNTEDGTSLLKSQYASDGILKIVNTIGGYAYEVTIINMFPVNITFPDYTADNSAPVEFQTTFNTDKILIEGSEISREEFSSILGSN